MLSGVRYIAFFTASLVFLAACSTNTLKQNPTPFDPDSLNVAALETYDAYIRALTLTAGKEKLEIPALYWTDRIRELKPIKVYRHRANIVVVQQISGNIETGKYIVLTLSSYLPHSGDDGFLFDPNPLREGVYHLGNGVFEFHREIEN